MGRVTTGIGEPFYGRRFGVGGPDTVPVLELAAFYDLPNFNPHNRGNIWAGA